MAFFLILFALIQAGGLVGQTAWAEPASVATVTSQTAFKPTPPPAIPQPKIMDTFRCQRKFTYKGKVFDCDSNVERDAERLRPLFTDEPAALAQLDTYQRNRQNVRNVAYIGSVGLFAALGGEITSRFLTDSNGNLTNTGTQLRNYTVIGGVGLALLSGLFSYAILHKNSKYVENAVAIHNQARPDAPIGLIDF